ncbi:SDR family NAD(P)-dependent oxidoreductase [Guyparkeria halophila]|uniref:SDR family NAD(P)-dependent oxidoreductase n=1 Tax=Guyparkeria halophila TaxID=47960 RepID=A0ABZ0YYJ4_9GAMM|nr:SDR family NAD(P)-dependent oxidoreductase [Guyparkeria halophila]WQH16788.1 SDR family NAD(P)-dependent oxidoreductase [Guyparkeria halophila]
MTDSKANSNARTERIYWLVGASSGIGAALTDRLVARGYRVAISARHQERLDERAARDPDRVLPLVADVTDPQSMATAYRALVAEWGMPDSVILNAGDYEPMGLADFDPALFERLIRVNFLGAVNGIETVREDFIARGAGEIVLTASVAGYRGLPYAAPYGASKAAMINLAESLHPEFERAGVAIRVINPGFVRTRLTDKNDFAMPGRIEPDKAADLIARGLEGRGFEILAPRGFGWVMKGLRLLPYALYFRLTRRMLKEPGQ